VRNCDYKYSVSTDRFSNVRTETVANLSTQHSIGMSAVVHTKGIRLQATPSTATGECQTVPCTSEAGCQAEPTGVVSQVQTDMSMAWKVNILGKINVTCVVSEFLFILQSALIKVFSSNFLNKVG